MFDMKKIGKKLVELRKENNLTQMELADKLGVSFQAISNWERGITMPDISHLPELSNIYNVSIDEILQNKTSSKIVTNIINNQTQEYVHNNDISVDEFTTITPILKPQQIKEVAKGINQINKNDNIYSILESLPFVSKETADKVVSVALENNFDLNYLVNNVLPFINTNLADKIVTESLSENLDINVLIETLPFVSRQTADKVVSVALENNFDLNYLVNNVLPFISINLADKIVTESLSENLDINVLIETLPFVSRQTADKVVKTSLNKDIDVNYLMDNVLPFISTPIVNKIIEKNLS